MIRINLLPFRTARKKENIRRQVSVFGLSLVLICLVLLWHALGLNREIARTQDQIATVKSQIAQFKEKADRVTAIKAKLKLLEDKLKIVASLQTRRNDQQVLLEELADRIVKERMWLESLSVEPNQIVLRGVAFDNPTIADFMKNLEASSLFSSVDLKRSVNRNFGENIRLKTFDLVCIKKTVSPGAPTEGK